MDLLPTQPQATPSPYSDSDSMPLKRSASRTMSIKRDIPDDFKVMTVPKLPDNLELPPLPTIENAIIKERVLTHSSILAQGRTRVNFSEGDGELKDNEKLEWVGDGILKLVCTMLLHRLWPDMREGPTTTIMSHLVSNVTLAQISQRYSLMQRIKVAPSARMAVQSSEKNQANLFESYIAGYFESIIQPFSTSDADADGNGNGNGQAVGKTQGQTYDEVSAWLVPVFTPIAHFIRDHLHAEQQRLTQNKDEDEGDDHIDPAVVTGSSAVLNEHFIGKVGTGLPEYLHSPTDGLLWKTSCTVTLRSGKKVSAETVQTGKKPGMQVAAYMILVKLGLVEKIA